MKLEMKNITKTFGAVKALTDVSFTLEEGSIHGLLGENGAGKTTLMNVLAGTFAPDSGKVMLDGNEVKGITPAKAFDLGIRFIHQELNLCNDLRVYQNMFLGEEIKKKGIVDRKTEIAKAQKVLDRMNSGIDAEETVANLTTANKQLVEIARALLFESKIIIMDEPTTALNTREIEHLFTLMRELQASGVSFIYISHKMPEIFEICSDYTVLRDGCFIESGKIADINEAMATELLIGHSLISENARDMYEKKIGKEVVLKADRISGEGFKDISFELHQGEIIVITGLQGSGCEEVVGALFGAQPLTGGKVSTANGDIHYHSERDAIRNGIAMVPRNRKERGILPDLSIRNNNSVAYFTAKHKKLVVSEKEEKERFLSNQDKMSIKIGSDMDPITSLSGGNQQKVIIGRWLSLDDPILIMDNPTQGIDVGAKFEIYKLINRLSSEGKAIIVVTNEFPEMYQVADKTIVLYKGEVNGILDREKLTEINVMTLSTGGRI